MKYLRFSKNEKIRKKFRLKSNLLKKLSKQAKKDNISKNMILNKALKQYFNTLSKDDLFIKAMVSENENA